MEIFVAGGMALQGNPLKCSCENTWLAKWLIRWMRETLQLHTSVVERGQSIQSIVRKITCEVCLRISKMATNAWFNYFIAPTFNRNCLKLYHF